MGVVFVVSLIGTFFFGNIFARYLWMSPLFHAIGGSLTAWLWLAVYRAAQGRYMVHISPKWVLSIMLIWGVICIGVAWEVWELFLDNYTSVTIQYSVTDTLLDLVFDGIGAILFVCIWYTRAPKDERNSDIRRIR